MIKSVVLNSNDVAVFASQHANVKRAMKELKATARQMYFHPESIAEMLSAKKVLDAIDNKAYTVSADDANTVYLNI